jgi:hypothetical protein
VSHAMVRSNQKAAKTMIAAFLHARPKSRLFHGRLFSWERIGPGSAAPGVGQGDLSALRPRRSARASPLRISSSMGLRAQLGPEARADGRGESERTGHTLSRVFRAVWSASFSACWNKAASERSLSLADPRDRRSRRREVDRTVSRSPPAGLGPNLLMKATHVPRALWPRRP